MNGRLVITLANEERRKPIACRQVGTELLHPEETLSCSVFISNESFKRNVRVKPFVCWIFARHVVKPIGLLSLCVPSVNSLSLTSRQKAGS